MDSNMDLGADSQHLTVSPTFGDAFFGSWTNVLAVIGAVCAGWLVFFRVLPYLCQALFMYVLSRLFGPRVDLTVEGPWAVVTGCTDGIGKAFAYKLASMGIKVVLISRNPQKLAHQAQEIKRRYNVETLTIAVDFTRQDIYDKIAIQLNGLDIGTLVNNVGMARDTPDFYDEMENKMQFIPHMINCNVCSVAMMTAIVLPGMVERERGVIINVSSAAGYRPLPMMALYSSTKGFVNYLTEALSHEYSSKGIVFQALTPYVVSTKMSQVVEGFMTPSPSTYVAHAFRSLGVRSPACGYYFHDFQHFLCTLAPLCFVKFFFIGLKKAMTNKKLKRSALMA